MIGIVICCHGSLGDGVRDAAEMIVGKQQQVAAVSVKPGDGGKELTDALQAAIAEVDDGDGALLLTDLFGGTPTNIGCTLLDKSELEIVTGFNLPLLIKALTSREQADSVTALAKVAADYGKRHISVAGELLKGGQ